MLAPPRVDPDGAAALWGNLAGLLRPRWRRLLFGQPHLCFEYLITADGSTIRIWVPGPIPPGLIEHAVTAAWPGATTRTTRRRPRTPRPAPGGAAVTTGGVLRLARPGGLPISDDAPGDPVAALLAAPGDPPHTLDDAGLADGRPRPPGDRVIVQVLARPVATQHGQPRAAAASRVGCSAPSARSRCGGSGRSSP